ncbi:metallophosphoesterase family protein [Lentibacillus saliphilus]|uniref:metallophosphoesterase family protein n=1 Tax=Lentibacillus saliphilus TaxID=2737028 RepID=UPI001C30085F|nr:metallophosphoesterase family protein [Lentibacillus saliphilus]
MDKKRILVMSDIHGALKQLNALLDKVSYDPNVDQLILLGDYVDRGPDSCGVLNKVMSLKDEGAIVLRGNHDDMLVAAVDGEPSAWDRWMRNGAEKTLLSYDATMTDELSLPKSDAFQAHVEFIKGLDYYYETDSHIFVHAGVDPELPIDETDSHELVWIRSKFHDGYHGQKTVVFGHTPTPNLHDDSEKYDVYFGENNIIGVDGGAVYGGQLNCLELSGNKMYSVKSNQNETSTVG